MSQKNVEIVRASYQAWNSGDTDALRELYDPNAMTLTGLEGWPEPGPLIGREAIMRQFERQREAFDADAVEAISFIHAGDRVVVRMVWRGVGHGPEANMEMTAVFTVRKSKIHYLEFFWDHVEALETLGLSEQDAHADS